MSVCGPGSNESSLAGCANADPTLQFSSNGVLGSVSKPIFNALWVSLAACIASAINQRSQVLTLTGKPPVTPDLSFETKPRTLDCVLLVYHRQTSKHDQTIHT